MSQATQSDLDEVVSLWRYPVKSMMGEELNATEVTERDCLEIVRTRWWTAPMRRSRPPKIPENGQPSLISVLASSILLAPGRTCLRSGLPCRTAP